ncbi:putative PurR-regulated permease PerM [Bradyrhizobium sp. cir1]|uniref:AI-2E family transporter n=1 Tax=Bradyrhizobium sp. cir1 TaxID=1445730 RepID=UPI001605F696|nr:AI-2E family transporter [Bradyrhizobium sp. cir1]MBB4373595.1 putative PurR-regulated permease PerM [Bradyrhizobium sp. cir1]
MTISRDERPQTRTDLARDQAWAISVGGIGVVLFTAMLAFTWHFAATLLLIFTGMLLGVGLNALTNALGRRVHLPHTVRLAIVCLVLAVLLAGVAYLGGATIAEQASLLSKTIKSQITNVRSFLENHGIDTSVFDLGNAAASTDAAPAPAPSPGAHGGLPGAGALASSGGAIVSQTFKLLFGAISAVGNIFIVLFLGLAFAAQPAVYHDGLLFLAPAKHRTRVTLIIDRISETLERWLVAQIVVMIAVGVVTWIGLAIIGIPGSFILGIQAGLLAFIPTVGAIIAGVVVVLASLASGWIPALSALLLFMGVHAMESYVLTPLLQRQALNIPPATLFAFQILLGVVFGIWGLALALPLVAITKVMIDHFKTYEAPPLAEAA